MIMGKRLEDIHPIREDLIRPAGDQNETNLDKKSATLSGLAG